MTYSKNGSVTLADWDRELPPGKTGDGATGYLLVHTTSLKIDLFNEHDSAQAHWWKVDKPPWW